MFNGRLSKKLLAAIMFLSGFFTLISISYSVHSDYVTRLENFELKVKETAAAIVLPLTYAIVNDDYPIIQAIANSFGHLSDEVAVAIKPKGQDAQHLYETEQYIFDKKNSPELRDNYVIYFGDIKPIPPGKLTNTTISMDRNFFQKIDKAYETLGGKLTTDSVGTIEVIAHNGHVWKDVVDNIRVIAITQAVKVFCMSFIILILIHQLVIVRQNQVTKWLKEFSNSSDTDALRIKSGLIMDELDDMAGAVNVMGQRISRHQKELVKEVAHRTKELVNKNAELEKAQSELKKILQLNQSALSSLESLHSTWIWQSDIFGNVFEMSDELESLILSKKNGKKTINLSEILLTNATTLSFKDLIKHSFEARESFTVNDASLVLDSGEILDVKVSGKPLFIDNEFQGFSGSILNISQEKKLHKLAFTDALTGIANRLALADYYLQVQQRAQRLNFKNGLMILDLDYFKSINDKYGHSVGDEVLIAVSHALSTCIRNEDCVARIGGEEFSIIVQGATAEGLVTLAKRINSKVAEVRMSSLPTEHVITVSIGFTLLEDSETLSNGLSRADKHLYIAKNNGRNRYSTDIK